MCHDLQADLHFGTWLVTFIKKLPHDNAAVLYFVLNTPDKSEQLFCCLEEFLDQMAAEIFQHLRCLPTDFLAVQLIAVHAQLA